MIDKANAYKEKVSKESKILCERYKGWGLLGNIDNEYIKEQMAILLENQRLMNESMTDSGYLTQFKRMSIPLVRRVFDQKIFLGWDLVNVQVLLSPTGFAFFDRADREIIEEAIAYTRKMQIQLFFNHDNDLEAEKVASLAVEVCNEINKGIITDLKNNSHIHAEVNWTNLVNNKVGVTASEALWGYVKGLFYRFEHGTEPRKPVPFGKKPNWLITSKELAADLKMAVDFVPRSEEEYRLLGKLTCIYTGVINKEIKLIECDDMMTNDILVGYKNGIYGSGYVYMPYVPFIFAPVELNPETFLPQLGLITRYGKRLAVNGSDFYAR